MLPTQACTILSLLAGASLVSAHGYVYSWTIDGEEHRGFNPDAQQGYSGAQRPTDNSDSKDNGWGPANRATGQVACGGNSAGSGLESWPIKAGSTVVAQWSGPKNGESVWPVEHLGPILEYMAKCPGTSCDGVAADSLDWFKIGEATYDGSEWPAAKITAGEDWAFTIPSDLAPGAYLVRHEIIALHFVWNEGTGKGFEVYPYCFQANLESSGSAVPSDTTTFPAAYAPDNYEWYDYSFPWDNRSPSDYVPPGPAVYSVGGASSPAPSTGGDSAGNASSTAPSASDSASASAPIGDDDDNSAPAPTVPSTGGDGQDSGEEEEEEVPSPTSGSGETDEETAPSATSAPAPSEPTGSGSNGTSSTRRTWGWWRNWRSSKTSSASAAQQTSTSDGADDEDEDEDEEYKRRNVIGRYAARQFAGF